MDDALTRACTSTFTAQQTLDLLTPLVHDEFKLDDPFRWRPVPLLHLLRASA